MKTLILTGADEPLHKVLDLTLNSKQEYAAKHGYDFLAKRSFAADTQCGFESKHVGFLKASTAFKLLRFYDTVMWVDADSIITNYNYKIENFIQGDECFIASYDWMFYNSFSTGNFIVRKTKDTESLFNLFLLLSKNRINDIMAEQGTLNLIHKTYPEYRHMFNVIPHKYLNSVPSFIVDSKTWIADNNRTGIVEPWTPDSFLAHFTGASTEDRIEMLSSNKLGI